MQTLSPLSGLLLLLTSLQSVILTECLAGMDVTSDLGEIPRHQCRGFSCLYCGGRQAIYHGNFKMTGFANFLLKGNVT